MPQELPLGLQHVDLNQLDIPTRIQYEYLLIPMYDYLYDDWVYFGENDEPIITTREKPLRYRHWALTSIMLDQFDLYIEQMRNYELAKGEIERANYRKEIQKKAEELAKLNPEYLPTKHHYAITIAPEEKYATLEHLSAMVTYINKASCVNRSKWCFEQRSEDDEEIRGIHVHMIIESTYPYSKIKQYIIDQRLVPKDIKKQKWKFSNPKVAVLNGFRECYNLDFENNYMEGFKHDEEKVKKSDKDLVWRRSVGIEDTYEYIRV